MEIVEINSSYDFALADLIRANLKKYALDIPGTVYFDDNLNHLSDFYLADPARRYYCILSDGDKNLVGGIGLAEFEHIDDCCELQKLYLADEVKGRRLSYKLISHIEDKAKELGYKRIYLETHDNLATAIHVYKKCGYKEIEKPESILHAMMNRFYIKEL